MDKGAAVRVEQIGDATLYLGDCLEILPTLGRCSSLCAKGERCCVTENGKCDVQTIDAVVTDPPYGIGIARAKNRGKNNLAKVTCYEESAWDDSRLSDNAIAAVIGSAKFACIWGGNYFSLPPSRTWLVWDKMLRGQDMADCELAWTNYTGKGVRVIRHLWSGFFRDGNDPRGVHPAQKPENVMRWCITQSPKANTVLDPFMGSGTTGVACAQLGRKFIGIEIHEPYFDIACRRIEDAYRQRPLFDEPKTPVYEQPELL